jgi:hypothetical protein
MRTVSEPIALDELRQLALDQFGDFVKAERVEFDAMINVRPAQSCSTLAEPRWRGRLKEIARARELVGDAASGGREYGTTLEALDGYFLAFAVAARTRRARLTSPGPPGA